MNTAFGLLGARTLDGDTDRTVLEAQRASAGRAVLLEQGHKGLAVRVPSHLHTWTVLAPGTGERLASDSCHLSPDIGH